MGRISYTVEIQVENTSADNLYDIIVESIIRKYGRYEYPVLMENKERRIYSCMLFLEHLRYFTMFLIFFNNEYFDVYFTFTFETKDNRFKYTMTDFIVYFKEHDLTYSIKEGFKGVMRQREKFISRSKSKLDQYNTPIINLEDFLKKGIRRSKWGKFYPSFQKKQQEFIDDLEKMVNARIHPSATDW